MKAKEYLSQAYRLDQRIDAKIEQVMSLRNLAAKATSTLSDVAPSGTRNVHRMEDIIMRIIDLENEVNADIDSLVALKHEITRIIKAVPNLEYQTLLELRYLCFKSWEQIAIEMNYSIQHIYRLREKAFKEIIADNFSELFAYCFFFDYFWKLVR